MATPGTGSGPRWLERPQAPVVGAHVELPETARYRMKRLLLGPPLVNEDLTGERLGKPTALAVLSSDVMSSCAYGTESILRILVPAAGVAAFALIAPVTGLLLVVLGLVCLCYRQVVKAYPVSGGSYVVSRENFGYAVAQIPGAALLCSYVLTVAVSVAAGVDAVISAFPVLSPYPVELSVAFVLLITFGNLRGIREAGRVFAVPTYWFLASMGVLLTAGVIRLLVQGQLHQYPLHAAGHVPIGISGGGLLLGCSVFLFLRGFANGGSAMTGMEAISNAVPVFKPPSVRNARTTLVLMATILGVMFLGVSVFAGLTHAVPFLSGTPTTLSEIGRAIFGSGPLGRLAYYSLQFSTALILVLGANTSYNGFPLLVSFIARDAYLPRPLTTRGHRLVYSNGIATLTVVSLVLLVATGARVSALIPLYSCTVFTGFTMAGAGMTKYHLSRPDEHHRGRKLAVAIAAFVASFIVTMIFVVTEFTHGAWLVVVAIPLLVLLLTRTHRRYEQEKQVLAEDVASTTTATEAPILRTHVVLVLVDSLDLATARAVQLARSLALSGEVRAVHFVTDSAHAERLATQWRQLGISQLPLELIECADRRLARATTELAAELAADGETEVTLVLPRRLYRGVFNRLLHANTADRIVAAVSTLPNVSATIAPFDVGKLLRRRRRAAREEEPPPSVVAAMTGAGPTGRTTASSMAGAATAAAPGSTGTGEARGAPGPESRERAQGAQPGPAGGALQPEPTPDAAHPSGSTPDAAHPPEPAPDRTGITPIADLAYRQRSRIAGRVRSIRVQPWSGVQTLECTVVDSTGALSVVFLGRRAVPGIEVGTKIRAEGMVGRHRGRLAMVNPVYELVESVVH